MRPGPAMFPMGPTRRVRAGPRIRRPVRPRRPDDRGPAAARRAGWTGRSRHHHRTASPLIALSSGWIDRLFGYPGIEVGGPAPRPPQPEEKRQ